STCALGVARGAPLTVTSPASTSARARVRLGASPRSTSRTSSRSLGPVRFGADTAGPSGCANAAGSARLTASALTQSAWLVARQRARSERDVVVVAAALDIVAAAAAVIALEAAASATTPGAAVAAAAGTAATAAAAFVTAAGAAAAAAHEPDLIGVDLR